MFIKYFEKESFWGCSFPTFYDVIRYRRPPSPDALWYQSIYMWRRDSPIKKENGISKRRRKPQIASCLFSIFPPSPSYSYYGILSLKSFPPYTLKNGLVRKIVGLEVTSFISNSTNLIICSLLEVSHKPYGLIIVSSISNTQIFTIISNLVIPYTSEISIHMEAEN